MTSCFGQLDIVKQDNYNPTVPRLYSMRHKAVSHKYKIEKPTIQDFAQKVSKEEINIFVVYEKDSIVGRGAGNGELTRPPQKLMDMYLIYDYTFRIFTESKEEINRIPKINILPGGFIEDVKIVNYFLDKKGKLKNHQFRKSDINIAFENGVLSVTPDKELLSNNSCTEVKIIVKSRNFIKIAPSLSNNGFFEKSLTISYPSIFNYKIPAEFKPGSIATSTYELLHFRRNVRGGNIDIVRVDSKIYMWSLFENGASNIEFELEGITIPPQKDIGIAPTDMVMEI